MNRAPTMLAQAFKASCLAELEALKPGNVHIFADGHGMVVMDFLRSAEAAAAVIAQPGLSVGQRIEAAVAATWQAVQCNTNLGVILLCAPLIQAAMQSEGGSLQARLQQVLDNLTVADAQATFRAIMQASPGGIGESSRHDVHDVPTVTLLEAMQEAQERDFIARQYGNGFADIFDVGVRHYGATLERWHSPAWAVTAVYLRFLAGFNDTHIARKYGIAVAQQVRQQAALYEQALLAADNPKACQRALLEFDAELKARGLNPGTSADLTVASLLAVAIEDIDNCNQAVSTES